MSTVFLPLEACVLHVGDYPGLFLYKEALKLLLFSYFALCVFGFWLDGF